VHVTRQLVSVLRTLLAAAFAALVLAQVAVLPWLFGQWAGKSPELAYLRLPTLAVSVLELLCVQVVILCTWRLLTHVEEDRIFSEDSFTWVDTILWAIAAAWVLLATFIGFVALGGLPGLAVVLVLMLVGGAVLGLLMGVMRALLRQATTLRADLEAVI
jgi:hypothetical protein